MVQVRPSGKVRPRAAPTHRDHERLADADAGCRRRGQAGAGIFALVASVMI